MTELRSKNAKMILERFKSQFGRPGISKVFAVILAFLEIISILFKSRITAEFESGVLRYINILPTNDPWLWIVPDFLILSCIISLWFWDNSKIFKYITLGLILPITIIDQIYYTSLSALFIWIDVSILFFPEIYNITKREISKSRKFQLWQERRQTQRLQKQDKVQNSRKKKLNKKNKRKTKKFRSFGEIQLYQKIIPFLLTLIILIPMIPTDTFENDLNPAYTFIYEGDSFSERKEYTLNNSGNNIARIARGESVSDNYFNYLFEEIEEEEESDFRMTELLRALYLDNITNVLSENIKEDIKGSLLGARYWYDEPGDTNPIFWTENHNLMYFTAELLAGQFYKNETFVRSQETGLIKIKNAEYLVNKWLDLKGMAGFNEWHSNTYTAVNIRTLLNLIDFAENQTIATKAAMVLDLICFDFANNYYKGLYATASARTYSRTKIGYDENHVPKIDATSQSAWILLGLGGFALERKHESEAAFIASSINYEPPEILEKIADDCKDNHEHWEKTGFSPSNPSEVGLSYSDEDLVFLWQASSTLSEWCIDYSITFMEENNIDPENVCGPGIPDIYKILANLRGISTSEFAGLIPEISNGIVMDQVTTYTYRTPYYQLSGAQDYNKGLSGVQEHLWQASLSRYAYVFTSSPGGVDFKAGSFNGGYKPRAAFKENVGVLIYDRQHEVIEGSVITSVIDRTLNLIGNNRPYNHAYFPKWAFDSVVSRNGWTFGEKDGGYIALYSSNPTIWASSYELVSLGKSATWLVEMGSVADYSNFEQFVNTIADSDVNIKKDPIGYTVEYNSPTQGLVEFSWEEDFVVNGTTIDLHEDNKFNNTYSQTNFASKITTIQFDGETLILNFENGTRTYMH